MVDLNVVEVEWTTGIGGTGLSVFYTLSTDDVTTNLATFFNAIKALFPNVVTWSIPSSGDTIDVVTGDLSGGWSGGTAATITATGGVATYAGGTGTWIRWSTNTIAGTRRLQGRTFLVPLTAATYDSDGTLQGAHVTTIQNAGTALAAVGKLLIYRRPFAGSETRDPYTGSAGLVTAAVARDRVTSLRTRRS